MAASTPFDDVFSAASPDAALSLLRRMPERGGLGVAYFHAAAQALGSQVDRLPFLQRVGEGLLRLTDEQDWVHRGRGAVAVGLGDFRRAAKEFRRAGETSADPVHQSAFQIGAIEPLARIGQVREATALADQLNRQLRELGEVGQAGRVLVALGNALLKVDRHSEARSAFERALDQLLGSDFAVEIAAAHLGRSTSALYGVDGESAERDAVSARDQFLAIGATHHALQASLNLALEQVFRGRPDAAVSALAELEGLASNPSTFAQLRLLRGGSYLKLNLWSEALNDLTEAAELARRASEPANVALAMTGQALALLGLNRASEAFDLAKKTTRRFSTLGNSAMEAKSLALQASSLPRERLKTALTRWSQAIELASRAEAPDIELEARVQRSLASAQGGAYVGEEIPTRLQGLAAHPEFAWRLAWAEALATTGEESFGYFEGMLDRMLEGRLLVVSTTARMTFLRDKEVALRQYLTRLLEDPTPSRVRQALDVVARTRSVSLADEILAANPAWLPEDARATLDELRRGDARDSQDGLRRVSSPLRGIDPRFAQLAAIRIQVSRAGSLIPEGASETGSIIYVASDNHWHLLSADREVARASRETIRRELDWFAFELSEPWIRPEAAATHALKHLTALRHQLALPAEIQESICPEGELWRIPWSAMTDTEPVLALGPGFDLPEGASLPANPVTALWVHGNPKLPKVDQEAERFLEIFPDAIVCRSVLDARQLLRGGRIDFLHVTGHATHLPDNPMMSAFQFPDGWITAAEIAMSDFQCKFAYLSACDTGRMGSPEGLEPDGMVRALLARGASAVVASLWALNDSAGAVIADHFLSRAAQGTPFRDALAFARKVARETWEHPFYWAGLALFAGYLHQRKPSCSALEGLRESCQPRARSV